MTRRPTLPARRPSPRLRALRAGFAALALLAVLGACSSTDDAYVERPVEELYNTAHDELDRGNFIPAARAFEEVERQHPYSPWATRAQVMAIYAFFEAQAYEEAIAAARRFIDLHPGDRDVPYAHYLIAMSYYERISDVGRDQLMTHEALEAFEELARRFPGSDYARDGRLKADLARDHLAGKEMEIGRYYLRRGQHVAAINRFRSVVENYQTTTHVPEALHRLTEAYLALGVASEAQASAAVLGYNFPGSRWYERSYALLQGRDLAPADDERSWFSRLLF